MGFRRRGGVTGTTSLAIVVPGEGVDPKRPGERALSLGQLVGKLKHGSTRLIPTPEDMRNIARPVKPLSYGAFGSYAPSYDSTFATITKEESSLIYSTFSSDPVNAQTERLLNYTKENDYALAMANSLVEMLGGAKEGEGPPPPPPKTPSPAPSLTNLSQLEASQGSPLTAEKGKEEEEDPVDRELNESWALLGRLHQEQSRRLSLPHPPHHPSPYELAIVDKVTRKLTDLAKDVPPGALAPVPAIRKAMRLPTDV